jgi:hypothetical protein
MSSDTRTELRKALDEAGIQSPQRKLVWAALELYAQNIRTATRVDARELNDTLTKIFSIQKHFEG